MTRSTTPRAGLRHLPAVDRLLRHADLASVVAARPAVLVKAWAQEVLAELRAEVLAGRGYTAADALAEAAARIATRAGRYERPYHRRVLNATGVLAHTGLGRAPLAAEAADALAAVARPCLVEIDAESGERGTRERAVAELLVRLTGAEAATVVNNNAAATLLGIDALARGREVILSRGELVEIGGAFRMPDVMEACGAFLREVGTTNRTRLADYERAVTERTGLLLKVHPSNFVIEGFTEEAALEELVDLGRRLGVPVMEDLGSGLLVRDPRILPKEPRVQDRVATGADVVCFSGDKLFGGPQAGILVGRAEAIRALRANPLFRALRPGKLTLAALEATLRIYAEGEAAVLARIPLFRALATPPETLERRARGFAAEIARSHPATRPLVERTRSYAGSGSAPMQVVPSWGVGLAVPDSPVTRAARLRLGEPGLFPRIERDRVWLDFRTLAPEEDAEALACVRSALEG